ncbi:MATE family efflux transporter [Lachnoclostridium sp. Marseille-P6806]|uniref:MATE family efflux transporter n=1 Tax=Lachnoclostridium sp. Marseille-P6806 TaxID=2364793 RepID=UPI0010305B88|nr:MATE family efflux transporter [Lachnoclostridium sp. Marseille-P6806]
MVNDRQFYKTFFSMALVLILQNVLTLSVNLADNVMLGVYSEVSLSGVAVINQIQFIYQQLLLAAGEGIVVLGSQYFGKKLEEPIRRLASIAMHFALVISALLFLTVSLFPHQILACFTTDEAIIAEGMRYQNAAIHMRLQDYFRTDKTLRGDYFRVMTPMLVVNGLWGLNNAAQNAILGHMTARAIAANSVASTLFVLVKSIAIGSASTSAYLAGKTIGEGDMTKLRAYARTLQVIFVGIGITAGLLLFFIRVPILSLYHLERETKAMANQFLIILSVVEVFMSYQMPTNAGIIRGGGDTRYCMKLDLISIWMIVIPVSFLMAFVVHASPIVVVWCLNADQIFKCVPAFIKCNYGHWTKKLTREQLIEPQ